VNGLANAISKCPQKGHFFIVLGCCILLLVFLLPSISGRYRVEEFQKKPGNSDLVLHEGSILTWNMGAGKATLIPDGSDPIHVDLDGYPIDGFFTPEDTELTAVLIQYLHPCVKVIDAGKGSTRNVCIDSKDWLPAALCRCGGRTWLAAFKGAPSEGVEKTFPYYVPVLNRFEYAVVPAEDLFEKRMRIRERAPGLYSDIWHEESAGPWKMVCSGTDALLLLNPTAEKLIRISIPEMHIGWAVDTGRKPVDLVFDANRNRAYVASAQQEAISVYDAATGEKVDRIMTGKGVNSLAITREHLIALNRYKRSMTIIDPDSKTMIVRQVHDSLPTGIAAGDRQFAVSFGDREEYFIGDLEKPGKNDFFHGRAN
jgi:hypothetical protein